MKRPSITSGIVTIAIATALLAILWPHEIAVTGAVSNNSQPVTGSVTFQEINISGQPFGQTMRVECIAGIYAGRLPNGVYEMRAFHESGEAVGRIGKPIEVGPFSRRHNFVWEDR